MNGFARAYYAAIAAFAANMASRRRSDVTRSVTRAEADRKEVDVWAKRAERWSAKAKGARTAAGDANG